MEIDLRTTMSSYLRPILAVVLTLAALLDLGWFLLLQRIQTESQWLLVSIGVCLFVGLALVGLNVELSRRTSVERNLAGQRKLLESILNGCPDAVVVADPAGKIIFRNPAALSMIPVLDPNATPKQTPQILGFYKPDGVTLYGHQELALRRTLRGETVKGLEICVRPPGKTEPIWLLEAGNPLVNDKGERTGGVVFLRDITDRKVSGQRVRAALLESEMNARESGELTRLADLLQSCQTLEEACKICENILPAIFHSQPGALFLINSSRNLLEAGAVWNRCSTTEQVFDPDDCWALRLGKLYGGSEPAPPVRCSHLASTWTGNYACVPLVAQGETLGILYVEESDDRTASLATDEPPVGHERVQRRAVAAAERLSLALSNLKLREVLRNQSIRDPLTGLFNRRYLEESLLREVNRATRKKRSIAVVMLDLDLYKNFNDTFGHQAGDLLLQEIAGVLKRRVRAGDLACRFGGEEFALIISEVDAYGAGLCVDVIRQEIKHLPLQYRGQALRSVTISAGIAIFPDHGGNPEDLIRAADAALYQAKRAGRDRMVVSGEEVSSPVSPA
jgi:diguanylate cyclase (GGDEF)-like protein